MEWIIPSDPVTCCSGGLWDNPGTMGKPLGKFRSWLLMLLTDIGRGMYLVMHSSLALLGLAVAALVLALWLQPLWLQSLEKQGLQWLREHQLLVWWLPENTAERARAIDLSELPPSQAAVADWLARKYRVAPEPVGALVAEASDLSASTRLPVNLILAVMAIESNFHPYVQSQAGAQGLMQVMGGIHARRFEAYGGGDAAFDPIVNLRVGAELLAEMIRHKDGSVEDGLRYYLGGDAVTDDGGYVAKVLAEKERLDRVAAGAKVPLQ
jgi:soluble lytic murein transglycosylase-like protein